MVLGSNFQRRASFRRAVFTASESRWARRKTRLPDRDVWCDAVSIPSLCHRPGSGGSRSCSVTFGPGLAARAPAASAVSQQPPQRLRVPHGVTAAVVVEIGVYILAGAAPLADPVRPPAQLVIGVRPAVQMLVVRA